MGSGNGFAGGYGWVARSAYATPAELGFKPWTADFTSEDGSPNYPSNRCLNPYARPGAPLLWRSSDWDPGLRHWSLPFDPRLTEWLQDVDLAEPSTLAAREFASQHRFWAPEGDTSSHLKELLRRGWLEAGDVSWWPSDTADGTACAHAFAVVRRELQTLEDQMQDDRVRYLGEALAQSDAIPAYIMHLLGADTPGKPWTMQLIRSAVAIGNVAYLFYKARVQRPRPSSLCPGLVPPFGPPRHPAFPSGHAFLGHFIALLLLEVPGIARQHGVGMDSDGQGCAGRQARPDELQGSRPIGGSLLWLAERLGRNRERMGLHYPSDSSAGRHLAAGLWTAVCVDRTLPVPTLLQTIDRACAEW